MKHSSGRRFRNRRYDESPGVTISKTRIVIGGFNAGETGEILTVIARSQILDHMDQEQVETEGMCAEEVIALFKAMQPAHLKVEEVE